MGVDLVNAGSGKSVSFNVYCWENVLALAEMYGWRPAGTQQPAAEEEGAEEEPWDSTNYFTNDGQVVTEEDARGLAAALENALDDIPDHDAADHKTEKRKTKSGGFIETVPPGAKISPLEALSGSNKRFVREFVAFCREGSFEIW